MPLYEYICKACGKTSEVLVSGSRQPSCPHCGSRQLDRQLSVFSARSSTPPSHHVPPCGTGGCPVGGGGCAGGGCPLGP